MTSLVYRDECLFSPFWLPGERSASGHPVEITTGGELSPRDRATREAGLAPGLVGLYQINLRVPPNAKPGDLNLVIEQNGVASNPAILPVR